jgi:hypothetical protein
MVCLPLVFQDRNTMRPISTWGTGKSSAMPHLLVIPDGNRAPRLRPLIRRLQVNAVPVPQPQ